MVFSVTTSDNKNLTLNDKTKKTYVLNIFYSAPDGETKKEYKTDFDCNLPVVSYFKRDMDSTQIEVKLLINATTTTLRNQYFNKIHTYFKNAAYFNMGDKSYKVIPLKIKIDTKRTKAVVFSLFFKSFGAEEITKTSMDLPDNTEIITNIGNNCKDFRLVGEGLSGNFRLDYQVDAYNHIYTPFISIPLDISSFQIDTLNEIYTATTTNGTSVNLLDETIYANFENYRNFIICLSNKFIGYIAPRFIAYFNTGTVTLSFYKKTIY